MEQKIPFVLQPIFDENEISVMEYFLQLSFFTNDLHITNSWTLCNSEEFQSFKKKSLEKYGGSLVSFWVDMNKLDPPQSFDNCSFSCELDLDYKNQLFEYGNISPPSGFQGNPTGTFRMLLFKVALGKVFNYSAKTKELQDNFLKEEIPSGFHSMQLVTDDEPKRFNSLYRVSDPSQVLLYAAVEFEFMPLKVQVPDPVCEMCESALAKWYCHQDRAHFCDACDMKQHGSTRIFSRHVRIPCSKSPNQFGLCEHHPTDVVDMVCLKCYSLLCSNCILFGKHSSPDFFDHPLMSTLDTYELSIEKNSHSDKNLNNRKNEILDKIKNRHNSSSQICANSKGVETKVDYCKKLLLEQLEDMKLKKMNYLNSVQRELNTQLKQIEWMQSSLHHLQLSLQSSQFILFKKRYDLLVKKYFTKNLKDYLEFPIWMHKELTLVGDTKITCSSVNNLSKSFSSTGTTLVNTDLNYNRTQNEGPSKEKVPDWTPLNMYENMGETVGRFNASGVSSENSEETNSISSSYTDSSGSSFFNGVSKKKLNKYDVEDTATKLWHFLSDFKMGTLIQLLRLVEAPERRLMVRHLFNLSNHFEQVESLFTNISASEMSGLFNEYGYCVLLRSSGLLNDVLSLLFCSNYSVKDNLDFLKQLTSPIELYFRKFLKVSDKNTSDEDTHVATDSSADESLETMANYCMVEVVFKVLALDIVSFPTCFQFVFYTLTDLFSKLKSEYSCYAVVDFICTLLSTYLLRYLTQYNLNNLLFKNKLNSSDNDTQSGVNVDNNEKYNKLKLFTRELSFKFGRAAIVVWELDSVTYKDSDEIRQSQKLFDWAQKMLVKPRLKSRLVLNNPSVEEVDESCNYILDQVSKFEKRLSAGQVDISYKKASELTSKYNFMHLFKMAHQIPI